MGSEWRGDPWHKTSNDLPNEPWYRALPPAARGLWTDLRCLAGKSPQPGVIDGPAVGEGHGSRFGSVASRLGYRTHEFRPALEALLRVGKVQLVPRLAGLTLDPQRIPKGSPVDPQRISDWTQCDIRLPEYAKARPGSAISTARVAKFRAAKRMQEGEWGSDDAPETSPETFQETFPKRSGNGLDVDVDVERAPLPPEGGSPAAPAGPPEPPSRRAAPKRRRRERPEQRRAVGRHAPPCARCGHESWQHFDEAKPARPGWDGCPCVAEGGCACDAYTIEAPDWAEEES